ncbi:MAG: hypothetical protein J7L77_06395 [Clostridiales bacterium]|nr:hypothetical protein [Clostridiales bacterium]
MIKRLYMMSDEELIKEKKWVEDNKDTFYKADYLMIVQEIDEALSMNYLERQKKLWDKNIKDLRDFIEMM